MIINRYLCKTIFPLLGAIGSIVIFFVTKTIKDEGTKYIGSLSQACNNPLGTIVLYLTLHILANPPP